MVSGFRILDGFEGLILVNQLKTKIYPHLYVYKSIIAVFHFIGFYVSDRKVPILVYRYYDSVVVFIKTSLKRIIMMNNNSWGQFFETEKNREGKKNYIWHRKNTSTLSVKLFCVFVDDRLPYS